jgi:hypothetical protein
VFIHAARCFGKAGIARCLLERHDGWWSTTNNQLSQLLRAHMRGFWDYDCPCSKGMLPETGTFKTSMEPLKFPPFGSFVEGPFWTLLARRVLEDWRLCTDPVPVLGYYGPVSGRHTRRFWRA